MNYIKG